MVHFWILPHRLPSAVQPACSEASCGSAFSATLGALSAARLSPVGGVGLIAQVGLEVLGVVENMSGLEQRVAGLRFFAPGSSADPSSGAAAQPPVDVTEAALAALAAVAPDLVARSDVFLPTKGGARAMAADMGVPFLGRIPLDPALSLAGTACPSCCRGP